MVHGFTQHCKTLERSLLVLLVLPTACTCLMGRDTKPDKVNMTSAISVCEGKGGLVGPVNLQRLQEQMRKTNTTSAWMNVKFEDVLGRWVFVDGSSLGNPTEYFQSPKRPIGCGSVHPGDKDSYFEENNCLFNGLPALCEYKNQSLVGTCGEKEDFFVTANTRNWFDARHACKHRGGDLAILKTKACIPKKGQPGQTLWTGLHSLSETVVQNETVTNVLANITVEGKIPLPELASGKACLIALYSTTMLWDIVPCSNKHHAFCLQDLGGHLTGTGNEASSSGLFGLLWIVIMEYLVFLQK